VSGSATSQEQGAPQEEGHPLSAPLGEIGALYFELNRRALAAAIKLREASAATLGCSLKEEVWRQDKTVLYRYLPLPFAPPAPAEPVLICFALVNRPYVLDL
jgi:polyhydroxyalkanoate synthase subunit PhaC